MNRIPFSPPKTIAELAALLDASPLNVEFDRELLGFGTLETATDTDVSFFSDPRYADRAIESQALLITTESLARLLPARPLLLTTRPERAVYRLLHAHRANADAQSDQREAAYLDPTATIGDGVRLGPGCSVARGVLIGAQTTVAAGAVIEADAVLGSECWIGANAVIGARCRLGNRVVVQAGSVIGSDGFGYLTDGGVHCRIPHLGIVVLEDDVEVGANSCIDRATLGETRIGRGTKIDNLVQIAHNVQIGEHSLLAAQTGVSGSTRLGRYNVAGGQTGYAGHLQLDDGVIVGARAGVSKNLKRGTYAGFPIAPLARFRVQTALISMLPKLHERLRRLERWLHEKENT